MRRPGRKTVSAPPTCRRSRSLTRKGAALRWLWVAVAVAVAVIALAATGEATSATQADTARGKEIFKANCAMCHGSDATGMMGMHPALTGVVDRLTREGVEVTIRNGRQTRPPMPAFGSRLNDEQIDGLIAYLQTLPDGPRNFGPDMEPKGGGMGGMMGGMGEGKTVLWVVIVILAAALAGAIGFLAGQRRRQ